MDDDELIYQLPPIKRRPVSGTLSTETPLGGWPINSWKIKQVHEMGIDGSSVKAGIGDTGTSKHHIESTKLLSQVKSLETFVGDRNPYDRNDHGSHVAGIVLGHAPKCEIASAKILTDAGWGSDSHISGGIDWMVDQGCKVINLSIGSDQRSDRIMSSIFRGVDRGVIFFIAAGNDSRDVDFPAAGGGSVIGCAIDWNLKPARFSSPGPTVTTRGICGGGVSVYSTTTSGFALFDGTSMATPGVMGQITLVIDAEIKFLGSQRTKSWINVIKLTDKYGQDFGTAGDDPKCGQGGIDVLKCVQDIKAESEGNQPEPEPEPGQAYQVSKFTDDGQTYSIYREIEA